MPFAYEKLQGLDRERLLAVVEPILRAHGLLGVEAIWRTDQRGWVLYLTVETPEASEPGASVTLDVCTELSRDLSSALDVADLIQAAYRLEVGSPGVERKLYQLDDYRRFSGKLAKLKCRQPIDGEWTLRGVLRGVDDQGRVLLETDWGEQGIAFEAIESGQLLLDLAAHGLGGARPSTRSRRAAARQSTKANAADAAAHPDARGKSSSGKRVR